MFKQLSQIGKNLSDELQKGLSEELAPLPQATDPTDSANMTNGNSTTDGLQPTGVGNDSDGTQDLPKDIQAKLRKFEKYELKYPALLNAYKNEKIRNEKIEKILTENTPLANLDDVDSLPAFFQNINTKHTIYNDEIKRLTKENNESRERLSDRTEIEELEKKFNSERENLQREIDEAKEQRQNVERQKDTSSADEVDRLKTLLEEKETMYLSEIKILEDKLAAAQKEKDDKQNKLEKVEKQYDEEQAQLLESQAREVTTLKTQLDESNKRLGDITSKMKPLEEQLVEKAKTIQELQEQLNKSTSAIELPTKTVTETEITTLKTTPMSKNQKKRNRKKNKKQNNAPTVATKEEEQAEKNPQPSTEEDNADTSGLLERYNTLLKDFEAFQSEHKDCKDWEEKYNETKSHLEELKDVSEKLAELEEEKNNLGAELSKTKEALTAKNTEVEEQREMMREIGNDLVAAKDQIKESSLGKNEEIARWTAQVENLKNENEKIISENKTKQSELEKNTAALTDEIEKLKTKYMDASKRLKDNEARMNEALSKIQNENNRLSNQMRDYNSVKTNVLQKEKTISYLENQIKGYTEEKIKTEKSIDMLKRENGILTNRLDLLKKENQTLHDNVKKNSNSYENYLKENGKLSERLSILQDKYDALQNIKSNSNEQTDSIKRQCEELNVKLREASKRIISLEDELNDYTTIIQDKTRETDTMRRLLSESQNDEKTRQHQLTEKVTQLTNEKEKLDSELSLQTARINREINDWKHITNDLKSEVHALKLREQQLLSEITTLNSLNDTMKRKSVATHEDSGELEKLTSNLKEALSKADGKIQELQNSNEQLMHLNNDVNKKLERITKNYRTLSNQLNALREGKEISARESRSNSVASSVSNHLTVGEPRKSSSTNDLAGSKRENELEQTEKVAYMKNVLLGFLEHREQRSQLLPVISMLLQLDSNDEKRLLMSLR
ncbi:Imh1p NDAI_0D02930 [Naumovozyma dairenensis CBS 421]|uniref:GRIP domain-containing protein n=1 Tax=Naumovozyma dairenensis (strain ATCC 10597 / BCRC 20456 / CBS 421 / NBRC 0211 / NRRL Y-12639) TaxID=1071378 RepID=G0W9Z6_NAUDC|nr:hypothetical protein NDAI_0D02930 [Naumovozyma dairenensis CBS 421]CCD24607.1 hypothetical protein NDAI_0D02930 [Naumovozyma dairenensis CBS 421]